jgi:hypothetical protein
MVVAGFARPLATGARCDGETRENMSRRLRFPKDMREGDGRLTYGVIVEAIKHGEWVTARVESQIIQVAVGEEERIRLSDEQDGHFYGYPDSVRRPEGDR